MEKKIYLLALLALLLLPLHVNAKKCPKCHGSGRMVVFPETGNYGVEKTKKKCPICRKYVYSGHREECNLCNGSGQVGSSAKKHEQQDSSSDLWSYLTPSEYATLMSLFESLKEQPYYPPCPTCDGTGKCKICGGVMNVDLDATNVCVACSGSGYCIRCNGVGTGPVEYREPENKDEIIANIKLFTDKARERMNKENGSYAEDGESSTDKYVDRKTSSSNSMDEEISTVDEVDKNASTSDDTTEDNIALFIGLLISVCFTICFIFFVYKIFS